MGEIVFRDLRMVLLSDEGVHSLELAVASGHADFRVSIPLTEHDSAVIENDQERAALLQAALHQPFQLKETWLDESEQRLYLDVILHAPEADVEAFLTEKDHGRANGAISNMVRITRGKDPSRLRGGRWFGH